MRCGLLIYIGDADKYSVRWVVGGLWCPVMICCSSVEQMLIDIRQPGCGGLSVGTRQALLQGWLLCVGFVCLANVPDLVRWVVSAKSWMLKCLQDVV
jgi:hypothetical protein